MIADDDPFFAAERQIAQFFAASGEPVKTWRGSGGELPGLPGRQQDFHLYLLGVEMPGMSGLELSEKILTLHPGARIVLLTGRSKQENACAVSAKLTTP